MKRHELAGRFEAFYAAVNRREFIHPDPLEFVYRYNDAADREIVGLIAAALAYGRVAQILGSVDRVLAPMGRSPREFLAVADVSALGSVCAGFGHRWTTSDEIFRLLAGIQDVLREHGSLEACFLAHHRLDEQTTVSGLCGLVQALGGPTSLLSDPAKNSACKRLHLYLRWMVRNDDVDPGCWRSVSPAHLIVPLDTHMHRIGRRLRLTRRKQANFAAALDITRSFRAMRPDDPLRYDFTLTRFGIRSEMDVEHLLNECGSRSGARMPLADRPVSQ